jgi:hypothetical protein
MHIRTIALAALTTAAFAVPALAHHSFAMFDAEKTVTVKGVVREFEWVNPHSWLRVTLQGPATAVRRNGRSRWARRNSRSAAAGSPTA